MTDPAMQRLCSSERENQMHPFTLMVRGRKWVAATDGCMFVATRHSKREPLGVASITRALAKMIRADAVGAVEGTVESLAAFVGDPVWDLPCSTCDGKGKVPAPILCPDCEGDGYVDCYCTECGDGHERECQLCGGIGDGLDSTETVECEDCLKGVTSDLASSKPEPVMIAGQLVDARRVARLLTPIAVAGDCKVWSDRSGGGGALHVRGDGWHLTLMGFRDEADDDTPRWP